jgi:hypothetical protein
MSDAPPPDAPEGDLPEGPTPDPPRRRSRWLRWLWRGGVAVAIVVLILAIAIAGGVGWALTPGGQSFLKRQLTTAVDGAMTEGSLTVGRLETDLFSGLTLEDVVLSDGQGRQVVRVGRADAGLAPWALLVWEARVSRLHLQDVDADLQMDEEGRLDVAALFGAYEPADPDAPPFQGLPIDIVVDDIALLDGHIRFRGAGQDLEVTDLGLKGRFVGRDKRFEVQDVSLAGTLLRPEPGVLGLDGGLVWDTDSLDPVDLTVRVMDSVARVEGQALDLGASGERLDLRLELDPLDLEDVDAFTGAGLAGRVGGPITATGPLSDITVAGRLTGRDGTDGELRVAGTVDATEPSWDGTVETDGLRVDHLLPALGDPLPLTTRIAVAGSGSQWPDGLEMTGQIRETALTAYGIEVDALRADVALRNGVLDLTGLAASAPAAEVTGSGAFDLQGGALVLDLDAADLDPAALSAVGAPPELAGTTGTASARVRIDAFAETPTVQVSGRADIAPFRYTADVRADRVRARYTARVEGTDVTVTAQGRAYALDAYGATVDTAEATDIRVAVRETGTRLTGRFTAEDLAYVFVPEAAADGLGRGVEASTAEGRWEIRVPADETAPLSVLAEGRLGPHRLLAYPGEEGTFEVDLQGDRVALQADLDATGARRLVDLDAVLDLETLTFTFDRLSLAPVPGQTWTAAPGATFRVDGAGIAEADLTLRSAAGTLDVSGTAGLEGEQDLDLTVSALDLEAVGELIPAWVSGLSGYGGAAVKLRGTGAHPMVCGTVEVADLTLALPPAEEDGEQDGQDDGSKDGADDGEDGSDDGEDGEEAPQPTPVARDLGLTLNILGGHARTLEDCTRREGVDPATTPGLLALWGRVDSTGEPILDMKANLPVDLAFDAPGLRADGRIQADLVVPSGRLGRFHQTFPAIPDLRGRASGHLQVKGRLSDPDVRLGAVAEVRSEQLQDRFRLEVDLERDEDGIRTALGALEGLRRRGELLARGEDRLERVLAWALGEGEEPDWDDPTALLDGLVADLDLVELPLGPLVEALDLPVDLVGTVRGVARARGPLMKPEVFVDLAVEEGRLGEVEVERLDLEIGREIGGDFQTGTQRLGSAPSDAPDPGEGRLGVRLEGLLRHLGDDPDDPEDDTEGRLRIEGGVPVDLDFTVPPEEMLAGDIDLEVDLDVPLAAVTAVDPGLRDVRGLLELDGRVDGTFASPEPHLEAAISEGARFTYRPLGLIWQDLELVLTLDAEKVVLEKLTARSRPSGLLGRVGDSGRQILEGGTQGRADGLEASGEATLEEWNVTDIQATLSLDRVLVVDTPDQTVRLSTPEALSVGGTLSFPRVRGQVRVDEADVFLDYAAALGGGPVDLDPRIVVHRDGSSVSTPPEPPSLFDDVDVELGVDLGRATRGRLTMPLEGLQWLGNTITSLTRVDVQARLTGDVTYRQIPCREPGPAGEPVPRPAVQGQCGLAHPRMQGVISIVEGDARVAASEFTLNDSSVTFTGGEVFNPNLDIQATMGAEDVQLDMSITGTAYDPEVDFSSPDTDQIYLTLLAGRPVDELSSQDAVALLTSIAFQGVLSGVNLPAVSIAPSGEVEVGLAVSRSIYAEVIIAGSPRPDQNSYELQAEFSLVEDLLLRIGNGDVVPFWGDLLFEQQFD